MKKLLQAGWKENSLEKVKECFRKVKRDYAIYLSTIADEVRITKTSSIEELHNLAAALNLEWLQSQLTGLYVQRAEIDSVHEQYMLKELWDTGAKNYNRIFIN